VVIATYSSLVRSGGRGVGIAEASLELVDEVEEGKKGRRGDVGGHRNLCVSGELTIWSSAASRASITSTA